VLHAGERAYVVEGGGTIEISSRALSLEAMAPILEQQLPADSRAALDEIGAVEHDLQPQPALAAERFTVVAARGGDTDFGSRCDDTVSAQGAVAAVGRLLDQAPDDRRLPRALATALRGVVAQTLRRTADGRLPVRELLLKTAGVAPLIAEGRIAELPLAFDERTDLRHQEVEHIIGSQP
jgi:hypothetical protein